MLFTISVQNHRLRLSGSNCLIFLCLGAFLASCAPKILRPGGKGTKTPTEKAPEKDKTENEKPEVEAPVHFNQIALLLPFQLNRVIDSLPNSRDVERASLALDFYQGFKLGLDQVANQGNNFKLHVLDTRDNTLEVQRVAANEQVTEADLIVGPVFPTEINAFGSRAHLEGKLQVSPLAASTPTGNQINNLVTVTPTIAVHAETIANYMVKQYGNAASRIVIFNNQDEDSQKLLNPLKADLEERHVTYTEVEALEDLEIALQATGKNLVVAGSTNLYAVSPLIASLARLKTEEGYDIALIGHPNWIKLNLNNEYLAALRTCITSSYYTDLSKQETAEFKAVYGERYKIQPTEFAYKGYDTGKFFGTLLAKYPTDYVKQLTEQKGDGIAIGFAFAFDPNSGYVNHHVQLLRFNGDGYKPLK